MVELDPNEVWFCFLIVKFQRIIIACEIRHCLKSTELEVPIIDANMKKNFDGS